MATHLLEVGQSKKITATKQGLANLFYGKRCLGNIIRVGQALLHLTGNEIAFSLYTPEDQLITTETGCAEGLVVVPSLGDGRIVKPPEFENSGLVQEGGEIHHLYAPVFDVHVHRDTVLPSKADLELTLEQTIRNYSLNGESMEADADAIQVISANLCRGNTALLFLQYKLEYQKKLACDLKGELEQERMIKLCASMAEDAKDEIMRLYFSGGKNRLVEIDEFYLKFVEFLESTGAFKALYHNYSGDKKTRVNPLGINVVERFVEKFNYYAQLTRIR